MSTDPAAALDVQPHEEGVAVSRRRTLLGRLVAAAGAAAAAIGAGIGLPRRRGPREQALQQADFYEPHDLAG